MRATPFILLSLAAAVIAAATFVEDAHGTPFVRSAIYGTWWFTALWTAVVLSATVSAIRQKLWHNVPLLVLHAGFGMIFAGALVTSLTGQSGILHLREGIPAGEYVNERKQVVRLPFLIRLDSFRIEYYKGTQAPADYISRVTCLTSDGTETARPQISMNRIYAGHGYRFYQSSYDEDMKGSWLTVNHDPWGTGITYCGFVLLCIGSLWVLCAPGGEFRRLLRHPLLRKGGFALLLLCLGGSLRAETSLPVLERAQADSLASRQVIYNGRVVPFDTPARDFMQKVHGRATFRGMTPVQVAGSWQLYPEAWNRVPVIRIKDHTLRETLGIGGEYASLSDLSDGQQDRLQPLRQQEAGQRGKTARAIQETDEKIGLILMLTQGTFVRPLPPEAERLSNARVGAELLYNRIPFNKALFMANLTLGFVGFGLLLRRLLKGRQESRTERRLWTAALWLSTLFQTCGYALRGYIGGNIPLANGYETMQFVSLAVLFTACLLQRRFPYTRPFGFLLSGFTLLVAHLGEMNPQITPLMPVLASPWLSYHVSFIMVSYALFAFVWLNGLLALCLMGRNWAKPFPAAGRQVKQLTLLSRLLLYPATFLLGIGILFGSVWANVSWGSYWSWDPKEVWAFVAFIIYGVSFHRKSLPWLRRPSAFHAYMVAAFAVVLMTYFGVNYLLGGMHSYANT